MSSLLDRAIAANGGAERWRAIEMIEAEIAVGGGLWARKGWPDVLKRAHLLAKAHEQWVRYVPFIESTQESLFTPDRVAISDLHGNVIKERENPRENFRGHSFATAWDDLHLAYFSGYAIWNYLTSPFLFAEPGFRCEEIGTWKEGNETWQKLHVKFPDHVATHCPDQIFYFDQDNLIRRLDYSAETTNSGDIAHYMYDHREIDGIVVPTRRATKVRNPDGTARPEPIFVSIEFLNIAFR